MSSLKFGLTKEQKKFLKRVHNVEPYSFYYEHINWVLKCGWYDKADKSLLNELNKEYLSRKTK